MRSKTDVLSALTSPGIIAVVRAQKPEQVLPLAEALLEGGVRAIEITMTTPGALNAIRTVSLKLGSAALIGVGTVLSAQTARAAIDARAESVVSPILRPEIADVARGADRPVMLGAFTPTEAQLAYEAGSDFIKIFPSDTLGAGYIKAILAPLPHLRIIPTGIAKLEDVTAFIKAGCVAVGLGSLLIPKQVLEASNWSEFTRLAKQFVSLIAQA